ncbi:MAG: RluA family pseudouridine synthase [Mesorhizobium sp.]|nr:RluA family pseudouridine synthase [Mesorhizobium sp.]MBL8576551.1 RluA family pseudouridine synthase [Mesorhizobium sp.]
MRDPDKEDPAELIVFLRLETGPDAAGRRLDQWLTHTLGADFSRSRVQALIRQGAVAVGGKPADDPGRKLKAGDVLDLNLPEPEAAEPVGEDIPLDILYEDAELVVINKPAGLVVHPGAGNETGTLVNALIHHCGDTLSGIGGVKRPGIVHRLDKETSGVMVVAKTDRAHRALSEAFADHGRTGDLQRAYVAAVWGAPERNAGTVDAPLGRAADRVRRAVVPAGRSDARHAVTHYKVLERFGASVVTGKPVGQNPTALASLVQCELETGRTHQIRVHMAHIGHPVVGDPDYGQAFRTKANRLVEPARTAAKTFPRQALHAQLLAFNHPVTGEMMRFEAPLPADMAELVTAFRAS